MSQDTGEVPGASIIHSDVETPLLRWKRLLFFLTSVFCVAVPGFASIKAIFILLVAGLIGLTSEVSVRSVIWLLSTLLSLAFYAEIALLHGVSISDCLNHLSRFFLFFLVLGTGAWVAASSHFDERATDLLIQTIAVLSVIFKIAILGAVAAGLVTFDSVLNFLGFESVTDSIGFGLQRLQFPSDIILIFLLACYSSRGRIVDLIFLFSVTISVFLSFSRYLFVAYAVCLMIRFFRMRKMDVISGTAVAVILLLLAVFSVSLSSRFGGEGSKVSDNIRAEQIRYLASAVLEHPLLGSGIGSSVNGYRRSDTMPFSYEVQWYAMAMQLGIVGLLWFLLNVAAPIAASSKSWVAGITTLAVLCVWVASGFTNPFILSLGSAFGLCILMLTQRNDDKKIKRAKTLSRTPQLGS